jgi:twitching motility protein PilI
MAKHSSGRVSAFDMILDFEQRSLAHAPGRPELIEAAGHWRGVGYRIGKRKLVSSFDEIIEIITLPALTSVPGAQNFMLGVANVRGNLIPVVDLKQFLEGERTVTTEGQRVLVVRQAGGNVAVLIDELYGQRTFNDTHVIGLDDAQYEGRYAHFVSQSYQLEGGQWGVFNMSLLTRTPEFRQAVL